MGELDADGNVTGYILSGGERVEADLYVSAMPVDVLKNLLPKPWKQMQFFSKMEALKGVPVMNLHLWFDRKLSSVNHLLFSRSPTLSVYADMSTTCAEYYDEARAPLPIRDQGRWLPSQAPEVQGGAHSTVGVQDPPQPGALQAHTEDPHQELLPGRRLHEAALLGFHGGRRLQWETMRERGR